LLTAIDLKLQRYKAPFYSQLLVCVAYENKINSLIQNIKK